MSQLADTTLAFLSGLLARRKLVAGLLVCGIGIAAAWVIGVNFFADAMPEPHTIENPDPPDYQAIDSKRPRLMARLGYGVDRAEAIVLSKDGKWLFSGGYDGTVGMWDFATGKEVRAFGPMPGAAWSLALSSNAKWLVVAGGGEARIWEVSTRTPRPTPWPKGTRITHVTLSANDRWIATRDDDGVRVWDVTTGREVRWLHGIGRPFAAIFSHDGEWLITSASTWGAGSVETNLVRLWDVASGKEARTFRGHPSRVESLTLSGDDQWLITTGDDHTARLWEMATGNEIRVFRGHTKYVTCSALSADKKRLVTGGYDQTLRVWDVDTGKTVSVLPEHAQAHTLALTADGKQMLSGTLGCVRLWDLATSKEIRRFERLAHRAYGQFLSSDGQRLITDHDGYWDLPAGKYVATAGPKGPGKKTLARSTDGNWMVTGDDSSAHLLDTATGREVHSLSWQKQRFLNLSSDAQWLVSVDEDNGLHLWDVATGKEMRTFMGHRRDEGSWLMWASISNDKKWLVSEGVLDCTLKVWSLTTGKEVLSLHNGDYWPPAAALSTDSRWLAASNGKIVELWDLATLRRVRSFQGHANHVVHVNFSGDGQWLLTRGARWGRTIDSNLSMENDKGITYRLWQVSSGKAVAAFLHPSWGFSAVLSHDGSRLITGSPDRTRRVRELPSGKELCRLVSFLDGTWAVYDAEGRYDSSNKDGIDGLYWVLGDETFPLGKFRDAYHDPGLLAKYMGYNSRPLIKVP